MLRYIRAMSTRELAKKYRAVARAAADETRIRADRVAIDLTGQRFGRLVAIERVDHDRRNRAARWIVKCDCGTVKEVVGATLRNGDAKSCGCLAAEKLEAARLRREIAQAAIAAAEAEGAIPSGVRP